jgi:hypothetical protein
MVSIPQQITMSYLEALEAEAVDYQARIATARRYHIGEQEVELTERVKEFLGMNGEGNELIKFRLNICRIVVKSLVDELNVVNILSDGAEEKKDEVEFVNKWWVKWKLAALQKELYEIVIRDGEGFMLLEWDEELKDVVPTVNQRFVSTEAGGDGFGVWIIYENEDPNKRPIAAIKQWTELRLKEGSEDEFETITRRNVYSDKKVEKYELEDDWVKTGEAVFKDVAGQPTEIALQVIHYKNDGLMPEAWDAFPMQNAINKTAVDALASADLTAFRMFFIFGTYPTIDGKAILPDGSNAWRFGPGQMNGTTNTDATVQVVDGADVSPLMKMLQDLVIMAAQITSTPPSKFIITGAIASEKTLKEQDRALRKKAETRKVVFGNAWRELFSTLIKINNHYGNTRMSPDEVPNVSWETNMDIETLKDKKSLDVPAPFLWEEMYAPDKVKAMKEDPSYRIEFEEKIFAGIQNAEASGFTMEFYLTRIGLTEEEIAKFVEARQPVVSTDMGAETGQ